METRRSVAAHLSSIAFLATTPTQTATARKELLGRWTDAAITLTLEPNNKLRWTCANQLDPLNIGKRVNGHAPDWWNFARWEIALMNSQHKCGTHVAVLQIDAQQLHLQSSHPHQIARVFVRF